MECEAIGREHSCQGVVQKVVFRSGNVFHLCQSAILEQLEHNRCLWNEDGERINIDDIPEEIT